MLKILFVGLVLSVSFASFAQGLELGGDVCVRGAGKTSFRIQKNSPYYSAEACLKQGGKIVQDSKKKTSVEASK